LGLAGVVLLAGVAGAQEVNTFPKSMLIQSSAKLKLPSDSKVRRKPADSA